MSDFGTELEARINEKIRDVPDFPKPGIVFKDLTPAFAHGPTMSAMIDAFATRYAALEIDAIVGIEARGFITAAPVAAAMSKGLVILRKPGKLPWTTVRQIYELEYGTDSLEMHEDAVMPGMRVVVTDDLLATGGTMAAAIDLLKGRGAEIVEVGVIVELGFLKGRERLDVPTAAQVRF